MHTHIFIYVSTLIKNKTNQSLYNKSHHINDNTKKLFRKYKQELQFLRLQKNNIFLDKINRRETL